MDKESERWNYKPTGKVQLNPLFSRSISIRAIFAWYASYWFQLSTTTLALILALLAWVFFFPSILSFQTLNWQSYGTLYLLNLILRIQTFWIFWDLKVPDFQVPDFQIS